VGVGASVGEGVGVIVAAGDGEGPAEGDGLVCPAALTAIGVGKLPTGWIIELMYVRATSIRQERMDWSVGLTAIVMASVNINARRMLIVISIFFVRFFL
jgi:hypothetical protein